MIRKKRGLGSLAAVAVSGATILGGLFVSSGTAFAVPPASTTTSDWTLPTGATATAIYPGGTSQQAANWTFTIHNNFTAGETFTVDIGPGVSPPGTTNFTQCQSGTDYVSFAAVPSASSPAGASTNNTADTAPKISVATSEQSTDGAGCTAAGVKDQLVLSIGNTATGLVGTTDSYTVTVSGVSYNVGAATPAAPGGTAIGTSGTDLPGTTGATVSTFNVAANAKLQPLAVASNTPPVGIVPGTSHAISNITLTESLPGTVNGTVSVTLPQTYETFTSTSTVTVSSGNATVCATSSCTTGASSASLPPGTTPSNVLSFYVKSPSTVPSTFTISGMTVSVTSAGTAHPGPQVATIVYDGSEDSVQTPAFAVIAYTRTAGFTADDTAAASFQSAFPDGPDTTDTNDACGSLASIVLVADFTPYDALSANYLASWAGTGVVITPYGSLSSAAANVIRNNGVGTVYIVGGTAAVSQAVQTQLQNTQAYCYGGTQADTNSAGPVKLNVVRIAGVTASDTSSLVAQYPGTSWPTSQAATPGAYPNTFNTTTGKSSASGPAATGSFTTAIVATDFTFQDSLGAGPLSYAHDLPVVLTDQSGLTNSAAAALVNLGIQQVYLLGGPGAISDAVVTSIQNLGISVVRIAGLTYSETSTQLARFELANLNSATTPVKEGLDILAPTAIGSSRGDNYPDALTSAAALYEAGRDFNPLILTQDTSTTGSSVDQFLKDAGNTVTQPLRTGLNVFALQVFGGTLAQTPALVQQELNDIAAG